MTFGHCFLLNSRCMFDVKKIAVVSAISYVAIAWGNFGFLPLMLRSMHFKRWLCNLYIDIYCIENIISCLQNIS